MSLVGKVWDFIKGAANKAVGVYVAVFGQDAGKKIADATLAFLKTELGKAALVAVAGLEQAALAGPDKKAEAFQQIVAALGSLAKGIPDDAIDTAIQLALRALRTGLADPPPIQ